MDEKILRKIGYGLYVLTANENGRDNGCIINTFMQVTGQPPDLSRVSCVFLLDETPCVLLRAPVDIRQL